jgi:hypothetical protein
MEVMEDVLIDHSGVSSQLRRIETGHRILVSPFEVGSKEQLSASVERSHRVVCGGRGL